MDYEKQKELLAACPGLAGYLGRDCFRLQAEKQPLFALQAGLHLAALANSNVRRGYRDVRTNLYSLGVAGTATGKASGQDYIAAILGKTGLMEMAIDTPGSKLAFTTALNAGCCSTLVVWDEIGKDLFSILGARPDSYAYGIASEMLKLFSRAKTTYQAPTVSESGQRKNYFFHQPNVGIMGMATPETLFKAIDSQSVTDGLLGRFIYFKGLDEPERVYENRDQRISAEALSLFKSQSRKLWKTGAGYRQEGKSSVIVGVPLDPWFTAYTPEAFDFYKQIPDILEAHMDSEDPIARRVQKRMLEHINKIALIVAADSKQYPGQTDPIDLATLSFATQLIYYTTQDLLKDLEYLLADTTYERECNMIVRFLNDNSPCPEFKLRAAFPMPVKKLDDRLESLEKAGRIEKEWNMYRSLEFGLLWDLKRKVKQRPYRG